MGQDYLLSQIKLFHWSVMKYSQHIALDKLYSSLSDNIDKFTISMSVSSDTSNIINYLELEIEKIKKIRG